MVDKPSITAQRTVSFHSEARASEEAGSLSAPRATLRGLNHVTLRTCFRSDRSHQLSIESNNHTQKWKGEDHDIIAPQGLKHQNT